MTGRHWAAPRRAASVQAFHRGTTACTTRSIAFTTPADAPRWKRWLVYLAAGAHRDLRAAVRCCSASAVRRRRCMRWAGAARTRRPLQHALAQLLMRALPALLAYLLLVRVVERRPPSRAGAAHAAAGRRARPARRACCCSVPWSACCGCSAATTSPAPTRMRTGCRTAGGRPGRGHRRGNHQPRRAVPHRRGRPGHLGRH